MFRRYDINLNIYSYIYIYWLVVYLPLWKIWTSVGMIIHSQYMESHKIHFPNHQPDIHVHTMVRFPMLNYRRVIPRSQQCFRLSSQGVYPYRFERFRSGDEERSLCSSVCFLYCVSLGITVWPCLYIPFLELHLQYHVGHIKTHRIHVWYIC
jgi:hypothetical protein